MFKGFFDRGPLVGRTRLYTIPALTIGSIAQREPVDFFTVGNPACFGHETELLLHPFLDFFIACHSATVSHRAK